ncbi:Uncharacterised protein [Vibrio cholerae]|nr:Uncharacterised protein [Vibrio cholerae]
MNFAFKSNSTLDDLLIFLFSIVNFKLNFFFTLTLGNES